MKTLKEVADMAEAIMVAHDKAAEWDAGFDAGEFSGPAHAYIVDRKIKELAEANGFTQQKIEDEVMRRSYEDNQRAQACADAFKPLSEWKPKEIMPYDLRSPEERERDEHIEWFKEGNDDGCPLCLELREQERTDLEDV